MGKSLDLNTIHNDTSPNAGHGYMRNQGFGPWELNLGAFLHEFDPVVWDYDYRIWAESRKPAATPWRMRDPLSIIVTAGRTRPRIRRSPLTRMNSRRPIPILNWKVSR